jgi:16S rRNA (uracil1498-N3)-methyltransferase
MKLHRFLIENLEQPLGGELKIIEKDLLHQWNNVLKFKKNEKIGIFDGSIEKDFIYKIKEINNKSAILEFDSEINNISQEKEVGDIHLCISLVKKEKISLIIEKCTEIGVLNFISLVSNRAEKKNIESFNLEKMIKISKESVEQSGWGYIPTIQEPKKLENIIKEIENKGELNKILILHTFDSKKHINTISNKENLKKLGFKYIFIGPEGGWSDKETAFFEEKQLSFINFGKNILRAETAAILSTFLISL